MATYRSVRIVLYLFLLPSLLMLLVFLIAPALWATYVSFTNRALAGETAANPSFVGLTNYIRLLRDTKFFHSLSVSFQFVLATIVTQFIIGLLAALLLAHKKVRGKGFFAALIVLPMIVPEVVQALVWVSMLAPGELGTLNRMISFLGVEPILWLRRTPLLSIILINLWGGVGYAMIFFMAGLENIPQELLEAAAIDGAGAWQKLIYVTLPMMRYVILLWALLTTLGTFGAFSWIFTLTRGGPAGATMVVGIYLYNESFKYFQLGYGSAAAMIVLLICLAIALLYVKLLRVEL
jgi:multiple sugar transport system permease protein